MKSSRLRYAEKSEDVIYQADMSWQLLGCYSCSWIVSGNARWKTVGTGGAKSHVMICLLSGIDHMKKVVRFVLILQVFSSYSGSFSLLVPRVGSDNSQLFGFFVRAVKHLSCLPFRALSCLPVSYVQVCDNKAFFSYVVIIAGDPGQKISWKKRVTVTYLISLFHSICCLSPSMGLDCIITFVLQGLTGLRHQHYSHLSFE